MALQWAGICKTSTTIALDLALIVLDLFLVVSQKWSHGLNEHQGPLSLKMVRACARVCVHVSDEEQCEEESILTARGIVFWGLHCHFVMIILLCCFIAQETC